jgi:hypothetical protein
LVNTARILLDATDPVIPACTYREPAFARDRLIPEYTLVQRISKAFWGKVSQLCRCEAGPAKFLAVTIARRRFLWDNRTPFLAKFPVK